MTPEQWQQEADKLELFLQGATDKGSKETTFADLLTQLAENIEPDPDFVADTGKRLGQAARQRAATLSPTPLPFWQQLNNFFLNWRNSPMKRTALVLASFLLVVIAGISLWQLTSNSTTNEPSGTLAQLPRLEGSGAQNGGFGGGLVETASENPAPQADPAFDSIDSKLWFNVFSGTQLIFNTVFPSEPIVAPVEQQPPVTITEAEARQIADRFGFSGTIYTQPPYEQRPGEESVVLPPSAYFAFNGKERLTLDPWGGISYQNDAVVVDWTTPPQPSDSDVTMLENFAKERGLLDFPYQAIKTQYGDIWFVRVINGTPVSNQPAVAATVWQGQIAYLYSSWQVGWTALGDYPLMPAETAWQFLLDNIISGTVPYEVQANEANFEPPSVEPAIVDEGLYQNWQRQYAQGQEAHLYTYPNVLIATDGSAPRIETYPLQIVAVDATLREIAANPNQLVHIWGIVGKDNELRVEGWEVVADQENAGIFLEGTLNLVDGIWQITTLDGQIYQIPDAPADLTDGIAVYLNGWRGTDPNAVIWENIDKKVEFTGEEIAPSEEEIFIDPIPFFSPAYQNVTVDNVTLGYSYTYIYPEYQEGVVDYTPPTIVLQPVWKFTGAADNGDIITFMVQAVAPEYLAPAN